MRCPLLLAILVYVGLDLSLAAMPGAFVFDPDDSVESVQVKRGRAAVDVAVKPAADALVRPRPPISLVDRPARQDGPVPARHAVVSYLPRATLAPTPPAEEDSHPLLPLA